MKLLILDRDGVITETPFTPSDECIPIPGSADAIARLCHAGYRIVLAALRTGGVELDEIHRIHDKLQICAVSAGGHLDAIFFSLVNDPSLSETERGRALFEEIAERLQISLRHVSAIGGTPAFVRSAESAGARTSLLRTGLQSQRALSEFHEVDQYDDLAAFAEALLSADGEVK